MTDREAKRVLAELAQDPSIKLPSRLADVLQVRAGSQPPRHVLTRPQITEIDPLATHAVTFYAHHCKAWQILRAIIRREVRTRSNSACSETRRLDPQHGGLRRRASRQHSLLEDDDQVRQARRRHALPTGDLFAAGAEELIGNLGLGTADQSATRLYPGRGAQEYAQSLLLPCHTLLTMHVDLDALTTATDEFMNAIVASLPRVPMYGIDPVRAT